MIELKVCMVADHPFDGWTDGGKYLIDTMGVIVDRPHSVTLISVNPVGAFDFIDTMPLVSTFFVIANIREVYRLVQAFPDRDIRMVLV